MSGLHRVLCLCPASRLSLSSLVLSSWDIDEVTLADERPADMSSFDAVIVMDNFVRRDVVEPLAAVIRVFVLAWNGAFEIARYRTELEDIDVTYVGTDLVAAGIRYVPMIDGSCRFASWSQRYGTKRQFFVVGTAAYRLRWLRVLTMRHRWLSVALAAAGAMRQRRALALTLRSGRIGERLVWAGTCQLDAAQLDDVSPDSRQWVEARMSSVHAIAMPEQRLREGLRLVTDWQAKTTSELPLGQSHHAYYVANTLLRWTILRYLLDEVRDSTWFFGRDNVGLGLDLELYVHNLVSPHRTAFLELGGKTSETSLYPRALHLLAGNYYVIPFGAGEAVDHIAGRLQDLARRIVTDRHAFFDAIERRRLDLYASLPDSATLADVQERVWGDFAANPFDQA